LIADELASILARFSVQEGALEELFMGRNRTSVIGVAQARGALLLGLARAEVPVFEYKPATVKSILTGYGMADKAQLGRMLSLQLRRGEVPGDNHAADAIAIAVCHARSRRLAVMAR
jgi:crossover junction endodeoxyribonuclease RuvC